jgi:hypothetical protein
VCVGRPTSRSEILSGACRRAKRIGMRNRKIPTPAARAPAVSGSSPGIAGEREPSSKRRRNTTVEPLKDEGSSVRSMESSMSAKA